MVAGRSSLGGCRKIKEIKIKWKRFQHDNLSGVEAAWAYVRASQTLGYAAHGVQSGQRKHVRTGF